MATKKGGLGRGLGSLFGDLTFDPEAVSIENTEKENLPEKSEPLQNVNKAEEVVFVKIGDIKPNTDQPRTDFDEKSLEELAASIKEYGVIQPILLRPAKKGYEIVAGERRWRASRKAGLKQIPAIIRNIDNRQNAYFALIENMQREDLNSLEEALGIEKLMNEYGLTQEQASFAIGKSRPYISNALRLLKLPEKIKDMLKNKQLSAGAARAIAGLKDESIQEEAAEKAVKNGWSVRQIESYTGSRRNPSKKEKNKINKNDLFKFKNIEEELTEAVCTRVIISGTEKNGKIELEYYSVEELNRLIDILKASIHK